MIANSRESSHKPDPKRSAEVVHNMLAPPQNDNSLANQPRTTSGTSFVGRKCTKPANGQASSLGQLTDSTQLAATFTPPRNVVEYGTMLVISVWSRVLITRTRGLLPGPLAVMMSSRPSLFQSTAATRTPP